MMKKNLRLEVYLNSKGMILPEDYEDYTTYGIFHKQCVFCHEPHLKYQIISAKQSNGDRAHMYACEDCAFEIDSLDINTIYKDSRSGEKILIAQDSIVRYIETGLLPEDVHLFSIGQPKEGDCVFCGNPSNEYSHLPVPQGTNQTKYITSSVCTCKDCTQDVDYLLHKFESDGPDERHYGDVNADQCKECDSYYPVTDEEFRTRQESDAIGEYFCNDCLEAQWGKERFLNTYCASCKTTYVIDLTLNPKYKEGDVFICNKCSKKMIEHIIRVEGNPIEVKLTITTAPCGNEVRYLYHAFFTQPELSRLHIEGIGCNYHTCDRSGSEKTRKECKCCSSAAEAGFKGAIEVIDYLNQKIEPW